MQAMTDFVDRSVLRNEKGFGGRVEGVGFEKVADEGAGFEEVAVSHVGVFACGESGQGWSVREKEETRDLECARRGAGSKKLGRRR